MSLKLHPICDCRVLFFIAAVLTVCDLAFCGDASNVDQPSLAEVTKALIAADAQFTDLSIDAETILPSAANPPGPARLLVGHYLMKFPEGWEFESQYEMPVSENRDRPAVAPRARVAAFDGVSTIFISEQLRTSRNPANNGLRDAVVGLGRLDLFAHFGNPHWNIWRYGDRSLTFQKLFSMPTSRFETRTQPERFGGEDTVRIKGTLDNNDMGLEIWVVPSKRFAPIRMRMTKVSTGVPFYEKVFSDFKRLSNGMWYPSVIMYGTNASNPETMITTRIVGMSADKLLQKDFQPTIPPRTHVSDHISNQNYVTIETTTRPSFPPLGQPR